MRKIFLTIAFFASVVGNVKASDLITQPEASMLVSDQTNKQNIINKLGDISVTNPSWVIQMPGQVPGFAASSGANYSSAPGIGWEADAGIGRVKYYSAPANGFMPNTYEFALNALTNASPCGQELDLFASAIQPPNAYGSGYRDANNNVAPSRVGQSTTLNNVSGVIMQLGLNIPYESINSSKCQAPNRVSYLVEVSARSVNGQFLFYQVHFRDSGDQGAYNVPCYPKSNTLYCFDTDASDPHVGGPANQPANGIRVAYSINLYKAITAAIGTTSDTNLANWHIEAGYFGVSLEGGVSTSSEWDSLKISVY